ncbi:iron chelate uptake ABC transporter family permease subunit [Planctomycetota bacterium]
MSELIDFYGIPFLSCMIIGLTLGYLGIHVLKREIIFIDIALAQFAAVGTVIAHVVFDAEEDELIAFLCSFGCIFLMAVFFALVHRQIRQVALEAIIGVSYAIAAAGVLFLLGVVVAGHTHADVHELLAGSLLYVSNIWPDVSLFLLALLLVMICFIIFRKPLNRLSDNYRLNIDQGWNMVAWDILFYAVMGIVITITVRTAGIVVVFSYLIIPATIAALFTNKLWGQLLIIAAAVLLASLCSVWLTQTYDFSFGPPIGMFLGVFLALAALAKRLFLPSPYKKASAVS